VSDEQPSEGSSLSPELARGLEPICDRFEAAWQAGTEPRLEDFLAEAPHVLRSALLRELILLDIEYRQARGQSYSTATYRQRFPELSEEWLASALQAGQRATADQAFVSREQSQEAGRRREPGTASTEAQPSERVGSWIGPYKLLQRLGEGGMGTVYVAEQERPVARRVALKIIKAGMDSARVIARFEQERQALAMMDHPNIAKVLDAGATGEVASGEWQVASQTPSTAHATHHSPLATPPGRPYFVMELVKGIPITTYCDQEHLTPRERLDLFIPVCQAVQHAHQKGIIHRDLKPSNVLIALYDGRPLPKVIDFGVAKATGQKLTERTMFTEVGQIIGTLEYMAPEQAELNNLDIDTRADIYSLGVLLYELLTGSPPFTAKQLRTAAFTEMLRMIREVEPLKPSTRVSTAENLPSLAALRKLEPKKLALLIRGDLDWIVMKCLEKERSRRYETASGLALELQRYLADEPVLAGPPSAGYKVRKFVKRNRGPVLAGMLVLVALLAGIVGTALGLIRAERARAAEAEQRGIAQANEKEAQSQKQRAIEFQNKALDALRATTDADVEKLIAGRKELGANEQAYLEAIVKRWQAFAAQEGSDEQTQALRGEGHFRVAQLWRRLGRPDEARMEFAQALETRLKLAAQFPAVPDYQNDLAHTYNNLGTVLAGLGKRDEARAEHEQARDIWQILAAQSPALPEYQRNLAATHYNLGNLFLSLAKLNEARGEYQRSREIWQELAARFPAEPDYRNALAKIHMNVGALLFNLGKRDEARGEFEQARDVQQKLVDQYPGVPDYQRILAGTHNNLAMVLAGLGKLGEARNEYERARDLQQKLVAQLPAIPDHQQELARTHNNLGNQLAELGKPDEARSEYEQSRELQQKLATQFPGVPGYRVDLGNAYSNFGFFILRQGKPAEALQWFAKAITTLTAVHDQEPRDPTARTFLRNSYQNRAIALDQLHRHAEAIKDWDMAIMFSSKSEQVELRTARACSRAKAGQVAEAIAEVADLISSGGENHGWYDFACVYAVASGKSPDKKQQYADRAMELLRKAVQAGFKDGPHMAKDPDLDLLRNREDFKKLLEELKAGKPTEKK